MPKPRRLQAPPPSAAQFEDEEFPAQADSVAEAPQDSPADVVWKRAPELVDSAGPTVLFDVAIPADVMKGATGGENWLLSAIAAVMEFPGYIEKFLFRDVTAVAEDGKYVVSLWDIASQAWVDLSLDDRIPCREKQW